MRLQLDTVARTIKIIEENINLNELIDCLEKILPKGEWKKYTLNTMAQVTYLTPAIVIPYTLPVIEPTYPWITYTVGDIKDGSSYLSSSEDYAIVKGEFNVEMIDHE